MSRNATVQPLYEILGVSVKKSSVPVPRSDWSACKTSSSAANALLSSDWPACAYPLSTMRNERGKKIWLSANHSAAFVLFFALTPKLNRSPFIREFSTLALYCIHYTSSCHQNLHPREPRRHREGRERTFSITLLVFPAHSMVRPEA